MTDSSFLSPMIADLKQQSSGLQSEMTAYIQTNESEKQQVLTGLRGILNELNKLQPLIDNGIGKCQKDLENAGDLVMQKAQQLKAVTTQLQQSHAEKDRLTAQITSLTAEKATIETTLNNANKDAADKHINHQELERQLKECSEKLKIAQDATKATDTAINAQRSSLDDLKNNLTGVNTQLQNLKKNSASGEYSQTIGEVTKKISEMINSNTSTNKPFRRPPPPAPTGGRNKNRKTHRTHRKTHRTHRKTKKIKGGYTYKKK